MIQWRRRRRWKVSVNSRSPTLTNLSSPPAAAADDGRLSVTSGGSIASSKTGTFPTSTGKNRAGGVKQPPVAGGLELQPQNSSEVPEPGAGVAEAVLSRLHCVRPSAPDTASAAAPPGLLPSDPTSAVGYYPAWTVSGRGNTLQRASDHFLHS